MKNVLMKNVLIKRVLVKKTVTKADKKNVRKIVLFLLLIGVFAILYLCGCLHKTAKESQSSALLTLNFPKISVPHYVMLDLNSDDYEDFIWLAFDEKNNIRRIIAIFSGDLQDKSLIYVDFDNNDTFYFLSDTNNLVLQKRETIKDTTNTSWYYYVLGYSKKWQTKIYSGVVIHDITQSAFEDEEWTKLHTEIKQAGIQFESITSSQSMITTYHLQNKSEIANRMTNWGLEEVVSDKYFELLSGSYDKSSLSLDDFEVSNGDATIILDSDFDDFSYGKEPIRIDESGQKYLKESYTDTYYYCWPFHTIWEYTGFRIGASNVNYFLKNRAEADSYITQILITDSSFKTSRDISVGSSYEDILNTYGEGVLCKSPQWSADYFILRYELDDKRLEFTVCEKDMTVSRIELVVVPQPAEHENILAGYNTSVLEIWKMLANKDTSLLNEITKDNPTLFNEILAELPRYATYYTEVVVTDLNLDGSKDILFREAADQSEYIQPFIYIFSGKAGNVSLVIQDEVDMTEYSYLSANGTFLYSAPSYGTVDCIDFSAFSYDENWDKQTICSVYVQIVPEFYLEDNPDWKVKHPEMADAGDYFFRYDSDGRKMISYGEFYEYLRELGADELFDAEFSSVLIGNYEK